MPGVHWQAVMMAQGTLDSSQAHGRTEFLAPELDLAQSLQAFGEMNLPLSLSLSSCPSTACPLSHTEKN